MEKTNSKLSDEDGAPVCSLPRLGKQIAKLGAFTKEQKHSPVTCTRTSSLLR